ncbi:MAG: NADH:flavin oxidoreductase [Myxococcales bacterium]|nr:NADH:flavin oxidoreductase [Myxococcales bacterium]
MPEVFSDAKLGPLTLRNRVIKAATFEGLTPDALVTDALVDFHRRHAAGGVGMTTVAYCAVAPEGRTERRQLWMRPDALPGLRALTDAVHAEGAAISAQLGHAGPVADALSNGLPALGPSRRLSPLTFRFIQPCTREDIARVTRAYAEAASLAVEAGFDAVELHFGHTYLLCAFLSPKMNKRKDGWGGSLDNRARFARDVARTVRERVGHRVAVLAKVELDEGVTGGITLDEAIPFAQRLEADGTLDALQLTAGSSFLNPMFLFRGDVPLAEFAAQFSQPLRLGLKLFGARFLKTYPYEEAYLLPLARQVRAAVKLPLVLLGGITRKETMDRAMAEGFDFVAMGRALLREPDLLRRMQADARTPSECTHCNKCMPSIYTGTRCVLVQPEPPSPAPRPVP